MENCGRIKRLKSFNYSSFASEVNFVFDNNDNNESEYSRPKDYFSDDEFYDFASENEYEDAPLIPKRNVCFLMIFIYEVLFLASQCIP